MSDDSSAFKNFINEKVVNHIAREIALVYPAFSDKKFRLVAKALPPLELKARVLAVTAALKEHLPDDYKQALTILVLVIKNKKLKGFDLWPFSEFIGQFGLDHFDESMQAMYSLTQEFTSEFAIRPYFLKDHQKVLKYFSAWTKDQNHHVRRWISEGSRPLLPWGAKLPIFIQQPKLTLTLLESLKFDEELYVRKSVANHLNDISKHHPDLLIETLTNWEKSCPDRQLEKLAWIKRQALRTLIKKGNTKALKLMGVKGEAKIKVGDLRLNQKKLKTGDKLEFEFDLISTANAEQKLVIDYLIYFVKANGSTSAKVFKLKSVQIKPKEKISIKKGHSLKPITTMTYYSGKHKIALQINGKIMTDAEWMFSA